MVHIVKKVHHSYERVYLFSVCGEVDAGGMVSMWQSEGIAGISPLLLYEPGMELRSWVLAQVCLAC